MTTPVAKLVEVIGCAAWAPRSAGASVCPVVTLNRAIALAMAHGPAAGPRLLDSLEGDPWLARHHRPPAVRAHLLELAGDTSARADRGLREKSYGEAGGKPQPGWMSGSSPGCRWGTGCTTTRAYRVRKPNGPSRRAYMPPWKGSWKATANAKSL